MRLIKTAPRVSNLTEYKRLSVVPTEPALREKLPHEQHLEAIRDAKEYLFQNTPQIKRITK
jgi:hypothetical protein